ncbi:MAG: hypothetical protein ACPLZF_02480 [Nitrososphaeria archaeon]
MNNMNCPVCNSTDIVLNQQINFKDSPVRKIYLSGLCKKCKSSLVIEFTPTSVRQQTVD